MWPLLIRTTILGKAQSLPEISSSLKPYLQSKNFSNPWYTRCNAFKLCYISMNHTLKCHCGFYAVVQLLFWILGFIANHRSIYGIVPRQVVGWLLCSSSRGRCTRRWTRGRPCSQPTSTWRWRSCRRRAGSSCALSPSWRSKPSNKIIF